MKNKLTGFFILLVVFASCKKDPPEIAPPVIQPLNHGMMVLNEGLFNMNNSTLSLYDVEKGMLVTNDLFTLQNHRGLGDTGNDMAMYGSRIYIVINISSQVEVVDAQGRSLKQIPIFTSDNKPRQPRSIAFHEGKAYVCSFDGTVSRIDTASLAVEAVTNVGRNPDGICVSANKLYVSNSGGLDFPGYDKSVSVIDIASFAEIKKIDVRINPYTIGADGHGDVYVVSRGNYKDVKSCLQRIDTRTDELVQTFEGMETLSFAIYKDKAYCYNYDFNQKTKSFQVLDLVTEQVETGQFITDGTEIKTPYAIAVDPVTEDVYIADAYGFTVNGDIYCFDKTGKMKSKTEMGLNPCKIIFTKE